MVLRIYTNKKKRVVKLSKINGEILISSVELQKYIKELIEWSKVSALNSKESL